AQPPTPPQDTPPTRQAPHHRQRAQQHPQQQAPTQTTHHKINPANTKITACLPQSQTNHPSTAPITPTPPRRAACRPPPPAPAHPPDHRILTPWQTAGNQTRTLRTSRTEGRRTSAMTDTGSIGGHIRQLRTSRLPRLTQRELAEKSGVSVDL